MNIRIQRPQSHYFFTRTYKVIFRAILILWLLLCPAIVKADWKSDADARIEQIRKRNAQITVVDQNSNPVPNISVQMEQVKHRFAFGTSIRYSPLLNISAYRNFIPSHFEWAVCDDDTKWGVNEPTRDNENYNNADYIVNWCMNNGIKMRGHCIAWEQQNAQFPAWLTSLGYATYPASSELLGEVDERINSVVNRYKGKFLNWDVDNEITSEATPFFTTRLGDAGIVHMFNYAKSIDPNCGMFMNEYRGNSFSGYDSTDYVNKAQDLIDLGATVDGFGIQAHLQENQTFRTEDYYDDVLQPLAVFDRPIWATEFDASNTDLIASANSIENFMRICFSHANVEGIIFWGFMQNQMWRSDSYLLASNGTTLSEAGVRYEALMDAWTTEETDYTDSNGIASFRGFHGTYEITLTKAGQGSRVYEIELEPGTTTQQFTFDTNFINTPPEYEPPTPNPMTWASAPYAIASSAITMTATTANDSVSPPVEYYFECTNDNSKSSEWQASATYVANGLAPLTSYSFRVKARDSAPALNETGYSGILSATTLVQPTDVNITGSWTTGLTHAAESGSDSVLILIAHGELNNSDLNLSSVTYGGQPMTKIIERNIGTGYRAYVAAYILDEAGIAAATSSTFSPTWSTAPESVSYSSAFFMNVDQTTSIIASAGNGTASSTPNPITTEALATGEGDMVAMGATCGNNGSYTVNNSFIEGTDQSVGTNGHTGVTGYKRATGASETPSATYSGTVNRQVIIGFVLNAMTPIVTCATIQAQGQGLQADLNHDCYIDSIDLKIVADNWLNECTEPENCGGADFAEINGTVDFSDFNVLANQWMMCNDPQDTDCSQN